MSNDHSTGGWWNRPAPRTYPGQTRDNRGGDPFGVGYTPPADGIGSGGSQGLPPFPWQGLYDAQQQQQQWTDDGLGMLTGAMGANHPLMGMLMQLFSSGEGMPERLMRAQRTRLAETEAGHRGSSQEQLRNRMEAVGAGNSAAAPFAEAQIGAQSQANLMGAMNELEIQNAIMAIDRQLGLGGLLAQILGIDAGLASQYAGIRAGQRAPIYPQGFTPGEQSDPFATAGPGGAAWGY